MIAIRILAAMSLIACGGKSQPPAPPISNAAPQNAKPAVEPVHTPMRPECDTNESEAKCATKFVVYFSARMCECKDRACADGVNDDYTKWGTEMAKNAGAKKSYEKPDVELVKEITAAVTRYSECFTKLATDADPNAGSGGTP